jgi:protoporphyrinogen/coproporphyrinogen III oxidase
MQAMGNHKMPHIAVVGGGITGLAAAYHLVRKCEGVPPQITLIEACDRLGGKIRTEAFAGLAVDLGPEAFVARVPEVRELCRGLGLEEELEAPATGKTYVWTRGRLRSLPDGLVYGVPTSAGAIARSGILSLPGAARAGLDLLLPRQHVPPDPSVMQVIGSRFGREVVERLVEPLLGGIHAGRADRLSLESVAPSLAAAAKRHRSLMLGLQSVRPSKEAKSSPILLSIAGGLERLVERLHKALMGVDVRTGTHVLSITPQSDGRCHLQCEPGPPLVADGILLTAPSWATAGMLQGMAPELAARLASIAYASVVTVTLGYPASALPRPVAGSGFLVPRVDGHLLTACTWCTNKWPHLQRSPMIIVRCSAARYGDTRALQLADDVLVERLHSELVQAMGIQGQPTERLITRWEQAIPQYEIGHQARVAEIESALARWPGIILAGAPYHGVGIASCIQSGAVAAARMRTQLATL